jgi:hypothetical protein
LGLCGYSNGETDDVQPAQNDGLALQPAFRNMLAATVDRKPLPQKMKSSPISDLCITPRALTLLGPVRAQFVETALQLDDRFLADRQRLLHHADVVLHVLGVSSADDGRVYGVVGQGET